MVVQDSLGEAMLPDPHRSDEEPLGGLDRHIRALTFPFLEFRFERSWRS
ncbi:hypothetical protein [Rhodococcoides yunnanense]|nr:hypothetical protein [Rhodococcus yunnanensis]MCZ4278866.1 hypothetical protein [Rhodococcus yunnanensis]